MTTIIKKNNVIPALSEVFFGTNWMDNFLEQSNSISHFKPAANIIENEKDFQIKIALPGINKEDIKIDLQDQKIAISGNTKKEEVHESAKFISKEIQNGSFHREFRIGNHIDAEHISAEFKDGILNLTLPKTEKASPKSIAIQ